MAVSWNVLSRIGAAIVGLATVVGGVYALVSLVDRWQRTDPPPAPAESIAAPAEDRAPESGGPTRGDIGRGEAGGNLREPSSGNALPPVPRGTDTVASAPLPLVNPRIVPATGTPVVAVALDGDPGEVELLEAELVRALSSPRRRLVSGYFRPAFRSQGLLRAALDGDTDILVRSGALAGVDRVLLGRAECSCGKTGLLDSDLFTCDLRLLYRLVDQRGAVVASGAVSAKGPGFSEEAARGRAVEVLVEQSGERLIGFE
jgi:hypothetical protein